MLSKNVSGQGLYLYAWNANTNAVDTGDAANITGSWSKDGGAPTAGFTTANPTEIGGGVYWQPLAQSETNGNALAYYWASTTAGVQIRPIIVLSDKGIVPSSAVPGAANGLTIAGSNAATTFTTLTSTGAFTINGTSDVAQTGDNYARIGATGSGLTSLAPSATALSTAQWTNALATNLGTLAGHDPGATLASQTNITGGTITTVTNLTNAPTAGDLTATMKTSVQTAADAAITANVTIVEINTDVDELITTVGAAGAGLTAVVLGATGLNSVLVAGITMPNAVKYIGAAVAGKTSSGAGSGTETYNDFSGALAFVVTLDGSANRTGNTYS